MPQQPSRVRGGWWNFLPGGLQGQVRGRLGAWMGKRALRGVRELPRWLAWWPEPQVGPHRARVAQGVAVSPDLSEEAPLLRGLRGEGKVLAGTKQRQGMEQLKWLLWGGDTKSIPKVQREVVVTSLAQ